MPEDEKESSAEQQPFLTRLKAWLKKGHERRRLAKRLWKARKPEKKAAIIMEYLAPLKQHFPDVSTNMSELEWLILIFSKRESRRRAYAMLRDKDSPRLSMDLDITLHPERRIDYEPAPLFHGLRYSISEYKWRRRVKKLLGGRSKEEVLKAAPYSYDWYYGSDYYNIYDNRTKEVVNGAASPENAELWIIERYLCELQGLPLPTDRYEDGNK